MSNVSLKDQISSVLQGLSLGSSATIVGLDIGMSGVKVTELVKISSNSFQLNNFGFHPLTEGIIIDDQFHQPDLLKTAIKSAFAQGGIKSKSICYGFPSQNTVIKKMHAPIGTRQEIEDHISWEAEQFLPFGADNAAISVYIPEGGEKQKEGVDVVMVAAKQDLVSNYDTLLKEAGFNVKIIDLQILSLINVFEISYSEEMEEYKKGTLLVDFGAQTTKILVYKEGLPIFTKVLSIGGVNVTEEIQKEIGLSFEEAEDLKLMRDDKGNTPQEITTIVMKIADKIVTQVKESINFYLSSSGQDRIFRCMATGGNLQLPGVLEALAKHTNLSVEIMDPFKKIKIKNKKISSEMLEQISYVGAVSIGLALRGLMTN